MSENLRAFEQGDEERRHRLLNPLAGDRCSSPMTAQESGLLLLVAVQRLGVPVREVGFVRHRRLCVSAFAPAAVRRQKTGCRNAIVHCLKVHLGCHAGHAARSGALSPVLRCRLLHEGDIRPRMGCALSEGTGGVSQMRTASGIPCGGRTTRRHGIPCSLTRRTFQI